MKLGLRFYTVYKLKYFIRKKVNISLIFCLNLHC